MRQNVYYRDSDREANDKRALDDIRSYCGQKAYEALLFETGRVAQVNTAEAFQQLNIAMSFCGIEGYPVHAWGRAHCLQAYRAWMHDGDKPVMTDEQGFPLETVS